MSFLEHLNPVQREAVRAIDGPVLIVAGAGSGKTRVLTYRAAYLIDSGVRPESILALTFTNKAAGEMRGRIQNLVGPESSAIWMGTFHSIFARILRVEARHLGFSRSFTIFDRDDSLALVRSVMNDLGMSLQQYSPQTILARISGAKNQMVTPEAYRGIALDRLSEHTAAVYEAYDRRLQQANGMDFDDLLLKPLDLFARHNDLLQRYQQRFRYILVDEYQDTNRVQYRLINELARSHRNICVVGDDAQSIYAFRGADIRNILDFEKDYPDSRVFRLEQNYRSTGSILAAADSVIRHNRDQIEKKLWTHNAEGEPVMLTVCEDDVDEGYRVLGHIEEESRKKKLDLKDFAVLYRTNAQSRAIEDALRKSGIPYVIVGGIAFYKRREIKDVLAYLRILTNPNDDESVLRIINVPPRGIGDTTVGKLRALATKHHASLLDILRSKQLKDAFPAKAVARLEEFSALVLKYTRLKPQMSMSELAGAMVDELGILRSLKEENTSESLERRSNVQELLTALGEFNTANPDAGLEDFLEEVSLVSDVDVADFGRNAVTLMTLHSAKGLEFPVVFITGLEEGLFPLASAANERSELEEERRLLYVGITRAKQKVFLSYAQARFQYGERTYAVRSRFLDEIEGSLLTTKKPVLQRTEPLYRSPAAEPVGQSAGVRSRRAARAKEDSRYFADETPRYEDESQIVQELKVGSLVVHEAFGRGKVVAMDGRGQNAKAIVEFESVGRKHLLLKFANLKCA